MGRVRYYSLVASLPKLDDFEVAERLPISRPRLDRRLSTLEPEHARQLQAAEALIGWEHQPIARTDRQNAVRYRQVLEVPTDPALRDFIEYRMGQRTVLVALRRRHAGMAAPPRGGDWGVGRWVQSIPEHWERPRFGLGWLFPWLGEASALLEEGDAFGLERLLMRVVWRRLSELQGTDPFDFTQVFAFAFKWDIVRRWLDYDAAPAKLRFQQLIEDAISEHEPLFA